MERRAQRVTEEFNRRVDVLHTQLVTPRPFGQVKVDEWDQLRRYLYDRDNGNLPKLREANGGNYSDALVEKAIAVVAGQYGDKDRPTVEQFRSGDTYARSPLRDSQMATMDYSWQNLVHRALRQLEG